MCYAQCPYFLDAELVLAIRCCAQFTSSGNDAENYIAPQSAAGKEMIVVTSNYRLAAAGFLALDELRSRDPEGSIGNYGTLDQRAAMKWIHDNIAAFGGDKVFLAWA